MTWEPEALEAPAPLPRLCLVPREGAPIYREIRRGMVDALPWLQVIEQWPGAVWHVKRGREQWVQVKRRA